MKLRDKVRQEEEDVDLDTLSHFHKGWDRWRSWSRVPQETRDLVAGTLMNEIMTFERRAQVAVGRNLPNDAEFNRSLAAIYRMACDRLRFLK